MKLFKIIGLILVLSPLGQAFGADAGASPLKLQEIVAKSIAGNIDETLSDDYFHELVPSIAQQVLKYVSLEKLKAIILAERAKEIPAGQAEEKRRSLKLISNIMEAIVGKLWSEEQVLAAYTLSNLARPNLRNNQANQNAIREAHAITHLVALLASESSSGTWLCASSALSSLAYNNQANQDAIRDAGAIPHFAALLQYPNIRLQEIAMCALANLAANNQANQDAIRDAGAIPHLVALLQYPNHQVQELASFALRSCTHKINLVTGQTT